MRTRKPRQKYAEEWVPESLFAVMSERAKKVERRANRYEEALVSVMNVGDRAAVGVAREALRLGESPGRLNDAERDRLRVRLNKAEGLLRDLENGAFMFHPKSIKADQVRAFLGSPETTGTRHA